MDKYTNRIWRRQQFTVTNPAPNVNGFLAVPSGVLWRPVSIIHSITTVVSTGAAFASVMFQSQAATLWEWDSGTDVGVGKTGWFYGAHETGSVYSNATEPSQSYPFPDLLLYPTDGIELGVWSHTGDTQIGSILITVDEALLGY